MRGEEALLVAVTTRVSGSSKDVMRVPLPYEAGQLWLHSTRTSLSKLLRVCRMEMLYPGCSTTKNMAEASPLWPVRKVFGMLFVVEESGLWALERSVA